MPNFTNTIPLSLYIHLPWCVQKCPYCDFNSHAAKGTLPETLYIEALMQEIDQHQSLIQDRPLRSIFFGGGTPSLFSVESIKAILEGVSARITCPPDMEITLEANPGTIDYVKFQGFHEAGINRLSLGVQSLQDDKLTVLGRIHDSKNAMQAIELAQAAGFTNLNIDLMYGLPNQSQDDAMADLQNALRFNPQHLSWYQLTIEPNTLFHHQPPVLPMEDAIWEMQLAGIELLKSAGFDQYEVSAYATDGLQCIHNTNYWEFGDYLGIGAGAHSKITTPDAILRFAQVKNPRDYLIAEKRREFTFREIEAADLGFEFMLNALRLINGVDAGLFEDRTRLSLEHVEMIMQQARKRGLLVSDGQRIQATVMGQRYLNNLVSMFL